MLASPPPAPPPRPRSIFALTARFKADSYDKKVNLGVGAYRDNAGKPWVLPSVKKVRDGEVAAACNLPLLTTRSHASPSLSLALPPARAQAQAALIADESVDHEYLSITGLSEFTSSSAKLILGRDSPAIAEKRVASVQTISGTGANHLGAVFLSKFYDYSKLAGGKRQIYISNPTWANHKAIFNSVGITPVDYPYVSR